MSFFMSIDFWFTRTAFLLFMTLPVLGSLSNEIPFNEVALESATYPKPGAQQLVKSTVILSKLCPWDLWIEIA